jgi:hypothetical protein
MRFEGVSKLSGHGRTPPSYNYAFRRYQAKSSICANMIGSIPATPKPSTPRHVICKESPIQTRNKGTCIPEIHFNGKIAPPIGMLACIFPGNRFQSGLAQPILAKKEFLDLVTGKSLSIKCIYTREDVLGFLDFQTLLAKVR